MAVIIIKDAPDDDLCELPDIQLRVQTVVAAAAFAHVRQYLSRKERRRIRIDGMEMLLYDAFLM